MFEKKAQEMMERAQYIQSLGNIYDSIWQAEHRKEGKKEMKKDVQIIINEKCKEEFGKAMEEFRTGFYEGKRLRTSNAYVFETDHYWILKSYNTIVAVTSKDTGICYDVLRIVYGYTSTSAQHIAKFAHDYHTPEYTWSAPKWVAR